MKLKFLTATIALYACLGMLPGPSFAKSVHSCTGEFNTEILESKVVDFECTGGVVIIDGNTKVNVPEVGHVLDVSWISAKNAVSKKEVTVSHFGSSLTISQRKLTQVTEPSNPMMSNSLKGSYQRNLYDTGCDNSSYSLDKSIFPFGVEWFYNPTSEPASTPNAIYRIGGAFATWKAESNRCGLSAGTNRFSSTYLGRTASPESMGGNPPPNELALCAPSRQIDGKNVIGWGLLPSGVIAATCLDYNLSTAVRDSDIRFSTLFNWYADATSDNCQSAYDLGDIATHEVGHMIGLGHSEPGTDQVMNPNAFGCNFWNRKLAKGDLTGFERLW